VNGYSPTQSTNKICYSVGEHMVQEISTDIRIECAPGIHFFLTKQEAESW
jgi:hypothetical protein